MDAMVPPNGTNPGFVVNDDSHGYKHFGSHGRDHDVVLHEIADGTRSILNDIGNNSRAVLSEIGSTSRTLGSDICKTSHDAIQATVGQGAETRGEVQFSRASTEAQIIALRENADRNFAEARIGIERSSGEIRRDNLSSFAALDKFLCSNFDNVTRDTLKGFADTQLDAAKNTASINLTVEKTAAAGILEAVKNASAISMQLAECCCEVKELVRGEGTATRELIQNNETTRLRDALAAANQELLTIRIGGGVAAVAARV